MRKTKIVCTLGPATDKDDVLEQLIRNGMNVARLNFSHETYDSHKVRVDKLKKLREQLNAPVALLLDTKGPEIRIKSFKTPTVQLNANDTFTFTTDDTVGDETIVSVTYDNFPAELSRGATILVDDGLVEFVVQDITKTDVHCRVVNGGTLSANKSINLPGINIHMPYLSEKDTNDIIFGIEQGFDFIAASFTRCANDVLEVKRVLEENGGSKIQIIAKIENHEGVQNIDEILKVSDGIMVARGDMGVEIPFEELPHIQKDLIKKAYSAGKKVITATQMLDSMMKNPRPTRAETTDVANAIYDGTSAIMLSGETAVGKYPVESLLAMSKIALMTERDINYIKRFNNTSYTPEPSVTDAISHSTCMTAHDLGAKAIITVTKSGVTARMVSKYRPQCDIIACTTDEVAYRQLNMSWGVTPIMASEIMTSTDDLIEHSIDLAVSNNHVQNGDLVVITAGVPLGVSGTTNLLKVHLVGHVLVKGNGISIPSNNSVCSKLCVCKTEEEALNKFEDGDILVIPETSNKLTKILKRASGIITESDGATSHAAIVGLTLDIPVIYGADNATKILKTGTTVTLDCNKGLVYCGQIKI